VLGSAQRRRKGAILQHGSLLLRRSEVVAEFPGIFDCAGKAVPDAELIEPLSWSVAQLFSSQVQVESLSAHERALAASFKRRVS
jgi:lipoate-protein ligase A